VTDPDHSPSHERTYVGGLDYILGGGIPPGRTTLLVGGPGSGKTILAAEFVTGGARNGDPGLFVSFDTTTERLRADLDAFHFGLDGLIDDGRLAFHHIDWDDIQLPASGTFTLDGLLLQLESLLGALGGARRLALDSIESLLATAGEHRALRRELRTLFDWLADRGITTVVTAERGGADLTPLGIEEYLSDCVILLEYDLEERIATRRLRVVKRRGGDHSGDKHPFLISDRGIRLFPLTASHLTHEAPAERVPSGIRALDEMLGDEGYYRGSSILVSGTPGAGKSSVAAAFVDAACRRGETALYYAFEESPKQVVRNMASVGYDLGRWVDEETLHIRAQRPSEFGLETHLVNMNRAIQEMAPDVVVLDPFTSLTAMGFHGTTRSMMIRLVDMLKSRGITALYTSLGAVDPDTPNSDGRGLISSLMDTWLVLEGRRRSGRFSRYLWVLKSRGMSHSRALHELNIGDDGVSLEPADESAWGAAS
jgi:circadian clock protein KaiC